MKFKPRKKQTTIIIIVVVVGLLLGGLILGMGKAQPPGAEQESGHTETKEHVDEKGHASTEPQKGPHGGKLFTKDDYALEVTIFEKDVEPEFRLYAYKNGKPLDPCLLYTSPSPRDS